MYSTVLQAYNLAMAGQFSLLDILDLMQEQLGGGEVRDKTG